MSNKYSSFKSHQLITENWRKFVNEKANAAELDTKMFPIALSAVDPNQAKTNATSGAAEFDGDAEDDVISVNLKGKWAAKDLKPSQTSMNLAKAAWFALGMLNGTMFDSGGPGGNIGAFVSKDNYLMDGHHRWLATAMAAPGAPMGGYAVDFPGTQLVAILNTITKGILGVNTGKSGKGNFAQFHDVGAVQKVLMAMAQDKSSFKGVAGAMEPGKALEVIQAKTGKEGAEAIEAMANFMVDNVKQVPGVSDGAVLTSNPRSDMPVIDDKDGPVQPASKLAIKALAKGHVNVNPPYNKAGAQPKVK
jgi:hypothetical protein|tara:strand:- start:27 stop:941 length:915 start_codon:yes stop_codon:yes gene_type:complete